MSGGMAFVYDPDDTLYRRLNGEMVDLDPVEPDDAEWLRGTLRSHAQATGSTVAARLLDRWHGEVRRFKKVMPRDYKRVLEAARIAEENGLDVDEAIMAAAHG
jgi:glutamate synthase (NADPH/NADH) large chain